MFGGLGRYWLRLSNDFNKHRFLSFAALFGVIYIGTYPFVPTVPTVQERLQKGTDLSDNDEGQTRL